MSAGLPAPLVPPDVDLRDFAFMPLDVVRLRDSGLTAKASGDEFRAAVLLWCASWHQVPAASLPDDDDELANICGYSRARREWNKISAGARRGWVKCSDGRLYHDRVAAKALEAWIEKLASAIGGAVGNSKRWNVEIDTDQQRAQFASAVAALRSLDPQSRTLKKKVVAVLTMPSRAESPPESRGESPPESPPESPTDRKGQGQGQGQGLIKQIQGGDHSTAVPPAKADPPPFLPDGNPEPEDPPGGGHREADAPPQPSLAGRACLAMRGANIHDVNPSHPDLLRLLAAGVTPEDIGATAAECAARGKGRMAYVLRTVESRRADAAKAPAVAAARPVQATTVPSTEGARTKAYLEAQANRGHTKPSAEMLAKLKAAAAAVTGT